MAEMHSWPSPVMIKSLLLINALKNTKELPPERS